MGSITHWKHDTGRSRYELPLIVETPSGKKDISEWAERQVIFDYWLALHSGGSEWNARVFVPWERLITLEHGQLYTRQELGLDSAWLKMPEKLQFIVERLGCDSFIVQSPSLKEGNG